MNFSMSHQDLDRLGEDFSKNRPISGDLIRAFCKEYVKLKTCFASYSLTCFPDAIRLGQARFTVANQTAELAAKVCDLPDLEIKANNLVNCYHAVGQGMDNLTSEERINAQQPMFSCLGILRSPKNALMLYMEEMIGTGIGAEHPFGNGPVLDGMCCALTRVSSCLPQVLALRQFCTSDAIRTMESLFATVLTHYDCSALPNNGCPSV